MGNFFPKKKKKKRKYSKWCCQFWGSPGPEAGTKEKKPTVKKFRDRTRGPPLPGPEKNRDSPRTWKGFWCWGLGGMGGVWNNESFWV